MIRIYATSDAQEQIDGMVTDLSRAYPGLPVEPMPAGSAPFAGTSGNPAWDDLLVLFFGSEALPQHLHAPIRKELQTATARKRASRILPVSSRSDNPIPPAPLDSVKALPCVDPHGGDRERVVRRVGALLGLWLRGDDRKVFVSHRQQDGKALAAQITEYLRSCGYDAWRDEEQLKGAEIVQEEIERHVNGAHLLLLLDTPQAKGSEWIWKEIDASIHGFVPILDLILRPVGTEPEDSEFLALNDLNHRHMEVALAADGSCELLSEDDLDRFLAAMEGYLSRILRLQMSLSGKAEETFKNAGFDWQILDDHRKMYASTKPDQDWSVTRILSHCSAVRPTFHQVVKAFQLYRAEPADLRLVPPPVAGITYNHRLFLYDTPLARPVLRRLAHDQGFQQDALLELLDIGGLARFLTRFGTEQED